MAKWGEGDPRWIVEQRSDAHNVNNWHWREIDSSEWSKDFLKTALANITLDDGRQVCMVTDVSTLEGESTCSVRKAKFICIFDWEKIVCKWTGNVAGLDTIFKGSITITNFDHDADDDDIDIEVRFQKDGPAEHPTLKSMIKKMAPARIWEAFTLYKETLREHFAKKLAFTNAETNNNNKPVIQEKSKTAIQMKTVTATKPAAASQNAGAKLITKKLTMTETFMGDVVDVYSALTDVNKIKVWSQGSLQLSFCPSSHELLKDAKFTMFGGNVAGTITGLNKPDKITMDWRLKQWPDGHFSQVEMKIERVNAGAKLTLEQRQVPGEFVQNTQEGWRRFYFQAIKQTMGLGGISF